VVLAALHGNLEVVPYLTVLGADINICSSKNITVFHLVSALCSLDCIKLLLDKEMSVNLTKSCDFTTLHVLAECGNMETTEVFV
jgi:ankyrin repeat protein